MKRGSYSGNEAGIGTSGRVAVWASPPATAAVGVPSFSSRFAGFRRSMDTQLLPPAMLRRYALELRSRTG